MMVLVSIFSFCMETHPAFSVQVTPAHVAHFYGISLSELYWDWYHINATDNAAIDAVTTTRRNDSQFNDFHILLPHPAFSVIDMVLMIFFTLELTVHFVFHPKKTRFLMNAMNVVDILSLLPFYVKLIFKAVHSANKYSSSFVKVIVVLRVFRIFRVMRLLRHYKGLQVLVLTLKHSWKEFLLLAVYVIISGILYGSLIYFANENEDFSSIPKCFWWALITMTTVGYGDMYPTTNLGYVVGAFCAINGVLVIAFTIPTLVNNFLLFYNHIEYRKPALLQSEKLNEIMETKKPLSNNMANSVHVS